MTNEIKLIQVSPENLAEIVKNAVSSELERFSDLFKKSDSTLEYLTRDEVCKRLKISKGTLNNRSRSGELPSHKVGRRVLYKNCEVEKYLNNQKRLSYGD